MNEECGKWPAIYVPHAAEAPLRKLELPRWIPGGETSLGERM